MASENGWGAPRIHGEILMLGFDVSERTISRYLLGLHRRPDARQSWLTFLRNHREAIAAMDLFVVFTVKFRLLYVLFVIHHDRRQIVHFNVTEHPTAAWVVQQPVGSAIDISAMPHTQHQHHQGGLLNLVDDPISSNPHASQAGERALEKGTLMRLVLKRVDCADDTLPIVVRQGFDFFECASLDFQRVGHRALPPNPALDPTDRANELPPQPDPHTRPSTARWLRERPPLGTCSTPSPCHRGERPTHRAGGL